MVNYIVHMENVFLKFAEDDRTTPWHYSLYMALFHIWNNSMFREEINVRRDEMMMLSKIGSANTYTRCIRELHEWGFIGYKASKSKFKSSKVHMYRFDNGADNGSDNSGDNGSDNTSVQHLRPFINNNKPNKTNKTIKTISSTDAMLASTSKGASLASLQSTDAMLASTVKGAMLASRSSKTHQRFVPPSLEQVQSFFSENKSDYLEAEKYFNHFQSNGWLVGGRTKMKDWQAAARNWILRAKSYAEKSNPTLQRLNAKQNTNYNEPL